MPISAEDPKHRITIREPFSRASRGYTELVVKDRDDVTFTARLDERWPRVGDRTTVRDASGKPVARIACTYLGVTKKKGWKRILGVAGEEYSVRDQDGEFATLTDESGALHMVLTRTNQRYTCVPRLLRMKRYIRYGERCIAETRWKLGMNELRIMLQETEHLFPVVLMGMVHFDVMRRAE